MKLTTNNGKASAVGAIDTVVAALRTHPKHPGVQDAGCDALWCLAFETDNVVVAWEKVVAAPWGIQMMWKAFRTHALKVPASERLTHLAMAAGKTATAGLHALGSAVVDAANSATRLAAKNVDSKMLRAAVAGSIQEFIGALLDHIQSASAMLTGRLGRMQKLGTQADVSN